MSILTATNIGQSFGAFDVFGGISVSIPNDGKIGLVGPNGIGKTTLLLILAGIAQPSSGSVHIAKGRRFGYLRQEAIEAFEQRENTVYGEMLTVFAGLQDMQRRLHQMEETMANGHESLMDEYGTLQEAFAQAGGYDYDVRIQKTLDGLGFGKDQWDMPLAHLSGGQKTRALLARLLLERPDLLILDEPTNHLDVDAIEWLETTLRNWDGAVLIVSHDRYFLDRTVNHIWEMSRGGIEVYRGNYSAYLMQRQDRWEQYNMLFERAKEHFAKEMEVNLARLESAMSSATGDDVDALLTEYSHAQETFERAGGYDYERRIAQVLYGLGFTRSEWDQSIDQLSGGQKTRALLARLLLEQPDLLILDEPTNHLDVEAVEWLEGLLRTWEGALLIVSHDRYFLDNVVNRIWEMSAAGFESYNGNYSAYVRQRQERWERREAEFNATKERFLGELDYIKRNIARDATKNQAVGRLRSSPRCG